MNKEKANKKALIALAVGGFGIGLTEFVIMGILPDVAKGLDITISEAGHFIAAYALGVVVGAPLVDAVQCQDGFAHDPIVVNGVVYPFQHPFRIYDQL